ncbi:hypothetical protein F6X34_19995 [Dickeya dianthicola]|uniref:hypothetical protein n=1 Tax=Dickeya dianthicola TaxID=204039 RepID=UPI00136B0B6E|nr:hypothetical protein [Dickeya dianthicola]MZG45126.1 hypothetical protein [Dickeya dianthicola]
MDKYYLVYKHDVVAPDNVTFSDLRLARNQDGSVSFDWTVVERICEANRLPVEAFRDAPQGDVITLILGWYFTHRHDNAGESDAVAEDLITEALSRS